MKYLFALFVLILATTTASARFPRGTATVQITCDVVTGVASVGGPCTSGATCDGSTDTAPAFWAFRTWALANQGANTQVVLTIPNGSDCAFQTNAGNAGGRLNGVQNTFAAGINNLLVNGTGATLRAVGAGFWLGAAGVCQVGLASASGCSARLQSVSPGATTVTLTASSLAAGYVSRFSTGDWVMIGGLDVQGLWNSPYGYPPNQSYFEWRQITNVNAGTGVITLDRPLANSYLSTWPNYNAGNNFEADAGGPATIWTVGQATATWNTTQEYVGLSFVAPSGQMNFPARNLTYRNVTFSGGMKGAIPTQNETFSAYNSTWPVIDVEVDKLIGTMTLDTVSMSLLQFQSNSVDTAIIRNSTFSNGLQGGGKRTEITDSSLGNFLVGSYIYGNSSQLTCTRCTVGSWANAGAGYDDLSGVMSMSGGVISFPNTAATGGDPAQKWVSPIPMTGFFSTNGASGQYSTLGAFSVTGVTQDATNTYIQTNQAGGFPTLTAYSGTRIQFKANGAPAFTCTDPDPASDPAFIAMCTNAGATPLAPMMSYASRTYTPSASGQAGAIPGVGKLVSLTIDVTVAGTAAGALTLAPAQFNANTVKQSDWSVYAWNYLINLKQTGTRVITPSGITCNGSPGGCSGDSGTLTVPEAVWLYAGLGAWVNGTPTSNPTFTMTLRTDQAP